MPPKPRALPAASAQRSPRQLVQADREGEHEQRLHRLLERPLDQVRRRQVGERDQQRAAHSPPGGQPLEQGQGRQRANHPDRHRQPAEGMHEACSGCLGGRHRQSVRAERVALVEQPPPAPWASRSAANRCCDMSGLSPVPRIPKRPSTKNGADAATVAASATGIPIAAACRSPAMRPGRMPSDAPASAAMATSDATPSPGSRTVPQATARDDAEADRGRQPGPLPPAAEREERLTDDARDGDYEQERPVRRQHRGRA